MIKFILGRVIGKATTSRFNFLVESETKKFEYCQVYHRVYDYVLCQVVELEKTEDKLIAICTIIGYKDKDGKIRGIMNPFDIGTEVLKAKEDFIRSIILHDKKRQTAFIGTLEGTNIKVKLDLNKLLNKHIAILAKTGSGKSYTVGVLLEEMISKNVPLLIIDPHGEYSSLRLPNKNKDDVSMLSVLGLKPVSYQVKINEYGNQDINEEFKPLTIIVYRYAPLGIVIF